MINVELIRFGIVGAAAFLVHFSVVTLCLVPAGLSPLLANVGGFLVAFVVSYLGHRHWTFRATDVEHLQSLPRFFAVSFFGFAVNETSYFILLKYARMEYRLALFIVLASVAVMTYLLGKLWAFAGTDAS